MAMASGFKTLILIAATLYLGGCVPSLPPTETPSPGTYRVDTNIRFQLAKRNFLLHIPQNYRNDSPLPLVVLLHGAFSTAEQTERETGFSELADKENFLVAYPEGIGLFGYLQHWNAGHCCGKAASDGIDDVAFVAEVIRVTREKLAVNSRRIYLAGMSNGGMLTHRFAAERGDMLAAAAVISGAIGSSNNGVETWQTPSPADAPPILLIHGDSDRHVPHLGGASPLGGRQDRLYLSLDQAGEFWRNTLACLDEPHLQNQQSGAVRKTSWTDCRGGKGVEQILLSNWGHQWPAPFFTGQLRESDPLYRYNVNPEIWSFFSSYSRDIPEKSEPHKASNIR
jgi:polyhydroxybutyrate depolymerase